MGTAHRGFVSLMAATLAVFVFALPAAAQDDEYVVEEGEADCPETLTQGADSSCSADGFEPGSEVAVEVLSDAFTITDTVTANDAGEVAFTFEVPCTAMQGDEGTITFTGPDGDGPGTREASTSFTVGGEVAACPEGLPTTGAFVTNGLLIAAAALILGIGFVVVARRRREGEHVEQS